MKSIRGVALEGKKVILRTDFNVPIADNIIEDDNRIVQSIPTIKYLTESGAKVIILCHLGKVKTEEDKEKNSLDLVAACLSGLFPKMVRYYPLTRGKELKNIVSEMNNGEILLIQNTRYEDVPNKLESACDMELSEYWASLGDIFVLDAFGAAHRNHASTYGIAKFIPSYAGFLIEREVNILDSALKSNKDLLLGGAKVEDKIGVIDNLITNSNHIMLGGQMCFTFLKAKGYDVGKSTIEEEKLEYAKNILKENKDKIILPLDLVTQNGIKDIHALSKDDIGYDIGPKTIELFKEILIKSPLLIWNGPLGWFENPAYENGTKEIMKYLNEKNVNTIVAGGDIGSAAKKFGYEFYHISTGGGATLEYLEGKKFKTFEVLEGESEKANF